MATAHFDHHGLTQRRERKGLSLRALGRTLGVSHTAVIYWENGNTVPDARRLPHLADTLGCSIGDLYATTPVDAP